MEAAVPTAPPALFGRTRWLINVWPKLLLSFFISFLPLSAHPVSFLTIPHGWKGKGSSLPMALITAHAESLCANAMHSAVCKEENFPLNTWNQRDFPHGWLLLCPQPWLLWADSSNYRCVIAELHSAIPMRDHCRQGHSLEKRQLWASSARIFLSSWEYFFPLSPPQHSPGFAYPNFHTPREEQSLLSQAHKPREEIWGQKSSLFCWLVFCFPYPAPQFLCYWIIL